MPWESVLELEGCLIDAPESNQPPYELIYSAELLTSLGDLAARQAIASAVGLLKPGGRLLVTNVMPNRERLECSACMGTCWNYRCEEDLAQLAADVPTHEIAGQIVFPDDSGSNACLELHKRH